MYNCTLSIRDIAYAAAESGRDYYAEKENWEGVDEIELWDESET